MDYPLKAIVNYRKHPSVIAIFSEFTKECFSFNMITIEDALKENSVLDSSKDIQAYNIPVKVLKGNSNVFCRRNIRLFQ